MIKTKKDLYEYLEQDAKACRRNSIKTNFLGDEVWKYQVLLRKCEYYSNQKGKHRKITTLQRMFCRLRFHNLAVKLGFSIPQNVFDKGFSISHYGSIVVNSNAVVGENCRIHEGVVIGATNGSKIAPKLGNNVFIGTGAKIIGEISIADDVAIGANAVVTKSITEPGTTWGGGGTGPQVKQ